jgi:V/A-type H+-transporting ATPase subunit D
MPREVSPTHSAYLELREERQGMEEGYNFLDEKRLILAAAMLAELQRYEAALAEFRRAYAIAVESLKAALARHGLEELEAHPGAGAWQGALSVRPRSVLGVLVNEVDCQLPERVEAPPPAASPEAGVCRKKFAGLLPLAAQLAAMTGNLERLSHEYSRTARRARALEDVLLPELEQELKSIDTAREEQEREEAIRVRRPLSQHFHAPPLVSARRQERRHEDDGALSSLDGCDERSRPAARGDRLRGGEARRARQRR